MFEYEFICFFVNVCWIADYITVFPLLDITVNEGKPSKSLQFK